MKLLLVALMFTVPFFSQASASAAEAEQMSSLDQVFNFLQENVMKKSFVVSKSGELDGGNLQYDFKRSKSYSWLSRGDQSITFKFSWAIDQKNYPVVAGQRVEADVEVNDRLGMTTCELKESEATKAVIGYCSVSFNTLIDSRGSADFVTFKVVGETLVQKSKTVGYGDYFSTEGRTPGITAGTIVFSKLENGKMQITTDNVSHYVNPETLEIIEGTEKIHQIIDLEK